MALRSLRVTAASSAFALAVAWFAGCDGRELPPVDDCGGVCGDPTPVPPGKPDAASAQSTMMMTTPDAGGGDDVITSDPSDGGGGATSDVVDAGIPDTGIADAGDDSGTNSMYQGYVSLWSDRPSTTSPGFHLLDAFFAILPPGQQSSQCTRTRIGSCEVDVCDQNAGAPGSGNIDAGTYTPANAGTIEVTGGYVTNGMKLVDTPLATGEYPTNVNGNSLIWAPAGGDTMSIVALGGNGAAVSPFSDTILTPALIQMSEPQMMSYSGQEIVIQMGDGPLDLRWTGGNATHQVVFEAEAANMNLVSLTSVTCTFTGDQGDVAEVPEQAMAALKLAGMTTAGSIAQADVYSVVQHPLQVGSFALNIYAQGYAQAPADNSTAYAQFDIIFF